MSDTTAIVTFTVNSKTVSLPASAYAAFMDDVHFSDPTASLEDNLAKYEYDLRTKIESQTTSAAKPTVN